MNNSAHEQRDPRATRATVVVIGALLALFGFNVATASAASEKIRFRLFENTPTFVFGDSAGFTSSIVPVSSYQLSYSNNNSCQPLQITETGFDPSWPRIESDVSTSTPNNTASLTVGNKNGTVYRFGSPMMFLTATQSGTGTTETLAFTMQFNSVTVTQGDGTVTRINCYAP
jgi:hypothetical protein